MGPPQTQSKWPAAGPCRKGICGNDAACHNLPNTTQHICLCPHDEQPPTRDLLCLNRKTVNPDSQSPIPISVITGPSTNSTLQEREDSVESLLTGWLPSVIGGVFILLIIIFLIIIIQRRKKAAECCEMDTPVSLNKPLIEANKYSDNPLYLTQYKTIPSSHITFLDPVGEGCFGKVYKGSLRTDDGDVTVAIKVLKDSANEEAEQDFMREVEIMSSFSHSNILSLIAISLKEGTKCPWMVFEFMPHGDLTDVLRSSNNSFPKSKPLVLDQEGLLWIALQIAHGMNYLAGQHFVHRDLACRNCLVGENLTVKIADFGMSRDVYTCDYYKVGGSRLLPVRWMSPESITYGRFTLESDIWSYGVVLWEIFTFGKQPYFGFSNQQVVKVILEGRKLQAPDDCPQSIEELMKACWILEPKDRVTFPSIVDKLENISAHSLPLPPTITHMGRLVSVTSRCDSDESLSSGSELDSEFYLKPNPPCPPQQYLQLTDSQTNIPLSLVH